MLNADSKNKIVRCLDYKGFSDNDFIIEESDKDGYGNGNYTEINIQLSYNTDCNIVIKVYENNPNAISIEFSPGSILKRESDEKVSFSTLPSRIKKWLDIVTIELLNSAQAKILNHKLAEQEKRILEINKRIDAMDDSDFTDDEESNIREKLDQLGASINEELKKLKEDNDELYKEIQKMQDELKLLQNTLSTTDKKTWLKAFVIKMMNWFSKPQNRQLLSAGIVLAKSALPQGVQEIVNISDLEK